MEKTKREGKEGDDKRVGALLEIRPDIVLGKS
jgi:hypothetical protein